jgi:hypothetical protein
MGDADAYNYDDSFDRGAEAAIGPPFLCEQGDCRRPAVARVGRGDLRWFVCELHERPWLWVGGRKRQ